jgi:alpha-tubulin suppressor-like RCC1 family protein
MAKFRRCLRYHVSLSAATLMLVLACGEEPEPTAPETPISASATAAAATLSFRQVSAGEDHSCGVTTDGKAYCWGRNFSGQLGTGSSDEQNRATPVAVAGGLIFRVISAGYDHTCALTPVNRLYCWGAGGIVGDGTTTRRFAPVPVGGSLRFRQVDAGVSHTCAVADGDQRAYCWGSNTSGQVGDGSTATSRLIPTPVAGTRRWRQLTAGFGNSCGLTTEGKAFCWGNDRHGEIGDGADISPTRTPKPVAGTHLFRQLDASWEHTCAVSMAGKAFCWGAGGSGQIGDGKTLNRFTPRAVAGGLTFDRVTAGDAHTCGETPTNQVYCWGNNVWGQLGDGTRTSHTTPQTIQGDLRFVQVSAGGFHTCGVASSEAGYCWGRNAFGTLGNGRAATGDFEPVPTAVAAPQ